MEQPVQGSQESQEELMEKIKNMSPEELLEFQKSRCIFCHIVAGKVQSKKIYEDDKVLGILDINPANPGHILLLTKEHYAIMPQVPEDVLGHLFVIAKKLSQIALKALGAKGVNIVVQNGIAAGQKAQHFMIHLIPRKENDGLNIALERKTMTDEDYIAIRDKLKPRVDELFGIKEAAKMSEPDVKDAEIIDEGLEKVNEELKDMNEDIEDLQGDIKKKEEESEKLTPEIKKNINKLEEDDVEEEKIGEVLKEIPEQEIEEAEEGHEKEEKEEEKKQEKKRERKREKESGDAGADLDDIANILG